MKKKIIVSVVVALVIAAVAVGYFRSRNNGSTFKSAPVTRGDMKASVTATGTVNAVTTVLVGTQVSGTIKQIYADFNSKVRKSQVIAQIDPATFEAQVEQARANVLAAKANVTKAKATVADSKRIMERYGQLLAKNLIARADLDTAEAKYETDLAQVHASEAAVEQTAAALRFAEINLRYTKIVSPVDGMVVSRNVDVGQTVAASFQTPTLFTIAQDLTKMQIDTNVDEADIGRVAVGQPVEFSVDAYPESIFKGKVSQVRIAPITIQNVVTYDVVIRVDNQELRLKPGMTANVSIIVAEKKALLKIPNGALRFKPADKDTPKGPGGKGPGVWVDENGKLKRLSLKTGISDGTYTEVVSGDLKEGQSVVVETLSKQGQKGTTGTQGVPRFIR